MSKLGIDVSYHQGKIDWQKVKASGIDFVIIRAGYGRDNIDKQFVNNVNGCIENNIPFGVYWFIYGVNAEEAIQNATKCHDVIKQYQDKITMRVWCDLEYDTDRNALKRGVTLTKDVRTEMIVAFCEKMKEYGYSVGNYANPDYLNNKLHDLTQYPLWLARYSTAKGNYECEMWQYSSKGSVPGVKGNVDMNYYYGEFKKKIEYYEAPEFTLLDSLNKIGVDSSYQNRKKIAKANGIENYSGTAEQNIQMLQMLNEGKLIEA